MKKLLLIGIGFILLIVGCDNSTDKEPKDCAGEIAKNVKLWGKCYNIENTTEINLAGNQLSGAIPEEIGQLTRLTKLYLNSNQLSGKIPAEIGNLTNLTYLNLSYNNLTNAIPVDIGKLKNLTNLNLYNNQLTSISENFCEIKSNLAYHHFDNNKICGELPSCLTSEEIGEQDCD